MNNFADRLIESIEQKKSCIIVGLDPRLELIPAPLTHSLTQSPPPKADPPQADKIAASIIYRFNKAIINTVHKYVVGVKPQIAFYERFGHWGIKAFFDTIDYAKKKGLIVIADVKRGDVPSTAQAYAEAYLKDSLDGPASADAVTVNPLLGEDSLQPFIKLAKENGKGLFVLVKTSNPGSKDFQDRVLDNGQRFYETIAEKITHWGKDLVGERGYSSLGAVVGATFPQEAQRLREIMRHNFFLVPGYGAQGGKAEDIKACFNHDPEGFRGALITASRSIIYAYQGTPSQDWKKAVRDAAKRMKQEISEVTRK